MNTVLWRTWVHKSFYTYKALSELNLTLFWKSVISCMSGRLWERKYHDIKRGVSIVFNKQLQKEIKTNIYIFSSGRDRSIWWLVLSVGYRPHRNLPMNMLFLWWVLKWDYLPFIRVSSCPPESWTNCGRIGREGDFVFRETAVFQVCHMACTSHLLPVCHDCQQHNSWHTTGNQEMVVASG